MKKGKTSRGKSKKKGRKTPSNHLGQQETKEIQSEVLDDVEQKDFSKTFNKNSMILEGKIDEEEKSSIGFSQIHVEPLPSPDAIKDRGNLIGVKKLAEDAITAVVDNKFLSALQPSEANVQSYLSHLQSQTKPQRLLL